MNCFFVALDGPAYIQLEPKISRRSEIHGIEVAWMQRRLPEGTTVDFRALGTEKNKLDAELSRLARQLGIRWEMLDEAKFEATAWDDLTESIITLRPEVVMLLKEIQDSLQTPERVKELYPRFAALLASLNIEDIIKNNVEFHEDSPFIPYDVYRRALDKFKRTYEFCFNQGYAFMVTSDG